MRRWVGLGVSVLLAWAWPAGAATYWVDASRPDDTAACAQAQTPATAKRTINGGLGCASAGDSVLVKKGVYDEVLANTIPSGVTLRSEQLCGAIIRPADGASGFLVTISGRSNITFDGFSVDAALQRGIGLLMTTTGGSSQITIQNSEFKNALHCSHVSSDSQGVGTDFNDTNITIRGNSIHDIGTDCLPDLVNPIGNYGSYTHSRNVLIEGNDYYNIAAYALHLHAHDFCPAGSTTPCGGYVIRNNLFHNLGLAAMIVSQNFAGVEFSNNRVYDVGRSPGWNAVQGVKVRPGVANVSVVENTFVRTGGPAIEVADGAVNVRTEPNSAQVSGPPDQSAAGTCGGALMQPRPAPRHLRLGLR